ncbi:NB-ARC domain-containing protein, partial [Cellulomonas shaoxiangyii]
APALVAPPAPAAPLAAAAPPAPTPTAAAVAHVDGYVRPAQLPPDIGTFVGRAEELVDVLRVAGAPDGTRIVSVVGVGGVGKTSLAVRAGHMLRDRFPDGQVHVNLRGFDPRHPPLTPSAALRQVLGALGVLSAPQQHEQLVALWRSMLADRRMLVLLDNASSADQVEDLLPGSATCFVLVTSRDRLAGLAVRHGARRVTLRRFDPAEATALLTRTIGAPALAREEAAARRLVELCDALPFALRIAAEQVVSDPGATIAATVARLEDSRHRLDALELDGGDTTTSVRHVLASSTAALDAEQSRALCLLGALPCASTSVLGAAALLDVPVARAAAVLAALGSQHLVDEAHGRFVMHDLTRAHAAELAARRPDDETRGARLRLLAWYVRTIADQSAQTRLAFDVPAAPHDVPALTDHAALLRWTVDELPNMTALIRDGQVHGHHALAWRLAALLFETFYAAGDAGEWLRLLRVALRSARAVDDRRGQAVLLNHASVACSRLGRNDLAVERLQEGLDVLGDDDWWYRVSLGLNLASTLREAGEYAAARPAAIDAHRLAGRIGDAYYEAASADVLCELYVETGDLSAAVEVGTPALAQARAARNRIVEANLLVNLGLASDGLLEHDVAEERFAQALRTCADIGDRYHEALALFGLARVRSGRGDAAAAAEARPLAERALVRFQELAAEEAGAVREFLALLTLEVG